MGTNKLATDCCHFGTHSSQQETAFKPPFSPVTKRNRKDTRLKFADSLKHNWWRHVTAAATSWDARSRCRISLTGSLLTQWCIFIRAECFQSLARYTPKITVLTQEICKILAEPKSIIIHNFTHLLSFWSGLLLAKGHTNARSTNVKTFQDTLIKT